jgi:DNA polymerase-3 subunit epsilon
LTEIDFVVVDLETTGGSPVDDAITEIGAVRFHGLERIGSFQTLVDPERPIRPTSPTSPASTIGSWRGRPPCRRSCRASSSSLVAPSSWRTTRRSTSAS